MAKKKQPTKRAPSKPSKGRAPSKPSKGRAPSKPSKAAALEVQRNREAWLTRACVALGDVFAACGFERPPAVRVSVGWPLGVRPGKRARAIGQIFHPSVSAGEWQVFISPELSARDPEQVLAVLAHELTHAIAGFAAGHGPAFRRIAEGIGLEGPMTATVPGARFKAHAANLLSALPEYPHPGMNFDALGGGDTPRKAPRGAPEGAPEEGDEPRHSGPKPQRNRWIRFECGACGWAGRTTAAGIVRGLPTCACGGAMRVPGAELDAPS